MQAFRMIQTDPDTGADVAVAEGVQFTDGTVALRWLEAPAIYDRARGVRPTTVIHETIFSVIALHAHDGARRIVWLWDEHC